MSDIMLNNFVYYTMRYKATCNVGLVLDVTKQLYHNAVFSLYW